jgi:excisionase family DNA binding protein
VPRSTPSRHSFASDDRVHLLEGDAALVLADVEPESIDAVVCDPPHAILRSAWDVLPAPQLWQAVFRALRPGAPVLVVCAPKTYHRLAVDIENAGFEIEDMLIWAFATGKPPGMDRLKPAHAPIVVARKPGPRKPLDIGNVRLPYVDQADAEQTRRIDTLRADGKRRAGIYDASLDTSSREHAPFVPKAGRWPPNLLLTEPLLGHHDRFFLIPKARTPNGHPAAKPVELLAYLLKLYTAPDDLVLDPFAGGGSTGVAALLTGRQALLIEREPSFAALARQNLAAAQGGDFGMPKRVNIASFLAEDDDIAAKNDMPKNEALRYPVERATLDRQERLATPDEMAALLRISKRTLRRLVLDGKVFAIPTGRGVRFDPVETLSRLKKQGEANDVGLLRQEGEFVRSPGPADSSGQGEAPKVSTRPRDPSRRARRREGHDRETGGRSIVGLPSASAPTGEGARGHGVGPGAEHGDNVAKLREAADTARLLLGSNRPPHKSDL